MYTSQGAYAVPSFMIHEVAELILTFLVYESRNFYLKCSHTITNSFKLKQVKSEVSWYHHFILYDHILNPAKLEWNYRTRYWTWQYIVRFKPYFYKIFRFCCKDLYYGLQDYGAILWSHRWILTLCMHVAAVFRKMEAVVCPKTTCYDNPEDHNSNSDSKCFLGKWFL
jgi:hypothetical protein